MSQTARTNKREPNLDLGILVGLLLTDGCVSISGGNWKITFTNSSEELHNIFKNSMKNAFKVTEFREWFDRKGVKSTEIKNKQIVKKLLELTPTFRTREFKGGTFPKPKIPEFIKNMKLKEIGKVLQVAFSADGCVCLGVKWNKTKNMWQFTRKVKISCKNPDLRNQFRELMVKLGLNPKIISERELTLERKDEIIKFRETIGFVNGVKVSRKSKNCFRSFN